MVLAKGVLSREHRDKSRRKNENIAPYHSFQPLATVNRRSIALQNPEPSTFDGSPQRSVFIL
jgi:hypothetical protein